MPVLLVGVTVYRAKVQAVAPISFSDLRNRLPGEPILSLLAGLYRTRNSHLAGNMIRLRVPPAAQQHTHRRIHHGGHSEPPQELPDDRQSGTIQQRSAAIFLDLNPWVRKLGLTKVVSNVVWLLHQF